MSDQLSLCLFWDIDTYYRWENDKITAPVKGHHATHRERTGKGEQNFVRRQKRFVQVPVIANRRFLLFKCLSMPCRSIHLGISQ